MSWSVKRLNLSVISSLCASTLHICHRFSIKVPEEWAIEYIFTPHLWVTCSFVAYAKRWPYPFSLTTLRRAGTMLNGLMDILYRLRRRSAGPLGTAISKQGTSSFSDIHIRGGRETWCSIELQTRPASLVHNHQSQNDNITEPGFSPNAEHVNRAANWRVYTDGSEEVTELKKKLKQRKKTLLSTREYSFYHVRLQ